MQLPQRCSAGARANDIIPLGVVRVNGQRKGIYGFFEAANRTAKIAKAARFSGFLRALGGLRSTAF
jgi:hypothetical protein